MRNAIFVILLSAVLWGQNSSWNLAPDSANIAILKFDFQTYAFEGAAYANYPSCPQCPSDSLPWDIVSQAAVDFGDITFRYLPSLDTLFFATIVWMGEGEILVPEAFTAADSFQYLDSLAFTPDTIYHFRQEVWEMNWWALRADTLWQTFQELGLENLTLFNAARTKIGLYLYPPTVGEFDANPAKWILFVYQDFAAQADPDTAFALSFFPLQTGNAWQYAGYSIPPFDPPTFTGYEMITVGGETTMTNGNTYFRVSGFGSSWDETYWRMDTTRLAVIQYNLLPDGVCPDSEFVLFDLSQIIDSTQIYYCNDENNYVITHTGNMNLPFIPGNRATITYEWFHTVSYHYTLMRGVGIQSFGFEEMGGWQGSLVAAHINGIQYGEFLTTEDENLSPDVYALHQNVPNPFNPVTTIRYDVPEQTRVKLTVLDLLGREVATLVDEEQAPGKKEVRFTARDLSSGVYFYRLTTPDFTTTRKLVVLK